MKLKDIPLSFLCHMQKVDESKIRIHFIPRQNKQGLFCIQNKFFFFFYLY
jgi:hypothetical protein